MSKTKKAAPGVQAESGGQMKFEGFGELPAEDFTISFVPVQGTMAFLLSKGRQSARTATELSEISGLHPRKVTEAIQRERLRGAPIVSDTTGFWIAENAKEVSHCARQLHRRAAQIHKTARALQKTVRRCRT